jgi:hypothetical protein
MDHRLQDLIHELATASIVDLFDPNPIGWTAQHEQDVRRVRLAIETATDQTAAKFKTPVNRNGFLLGCLDLTEHEPVEHLILGYGFRHGSTTKISNERSAPIPEARASSRERRLCRFSARILLVNPEEGLVGVLLIESDKPHLACRT